LLEHLFSLEFVILTTPAAVDCLEYRVPVAMLTNLKESMPLVKVTLTTELSGTKA